MTTFVALYRGQTIAEARLIAVTADPSLVADVSARLLEQTVPDGGDPIIDGIDRGKRAALRLIRREAEEARHQ